MDIVLYSDDLLLLQRWNKILDKKCKIYYNYSDLSKIHDSLIIINYTAFEDDLQESIKQLNERTNKILILDHNPSIMNAKKLLKLGAKGYGHILMKEHFMISAVESIKDGMVWLHSEFTSMLLNDSTSKTDDKESLNLEMLTSREKEVALLLKDGFSHKEIAYKLSITPRTIKAHAQNIYTKLHVKDRFALAKLFK